MMSLTKEEWFDLPKIDKFSNDFENQEFNTQMALGLLNEVQEYWCRTCDNYKEEKCDCYFPRFKKQMIEKIFNHFDIKEDYWIPCDERMPVEHYSIFAELKGTDKWKNCMFERKSDEVNVTIEYKNGFRRVLTTHTIDGKWKKVSTMEHKVIAWKPLPKPYKERK